jgi:hypothetical protein
MEAVVRERKRLQALIAKYSPEDVFNAGETALFWKRAPDQGLATQQMSGKKQTKDKTRIMINFMVSLTGQKLEPMFIGKYLKPRPFKKKTGQQLGLYYQANKKAWMNAVLFDVTTFRVT